MTTQPIALAALDGGGKPVTLRGDQNGDNSVALRSSLEVGGAAVGPGNAVPVADTTLTAAAGAPADAAYAGSGTSSIVAALKGLYALLAGTLTATLSGALPAGTNALGTVGVTALPALAAGTNTIGAVGVTALPANGVTVTVTTVTLSANTDAQLIAVNPNRKSLAIWNTGSGLLSLGFGAAAAAGTGVTYGSTGQAIGRTWGLGDGVPTQAIHGISAAGTTVVIEEGV